MNPKSLYHYTKIDSAEKIILNRSLKLSMYPKVNDPFDMAKDIIYYPENDDELYTAIYNYFKLHENSRKKSKEDEMPRLLGKVRKYIQEWSLKKTVANTPFLCFSADYNIPLMWGHYGDGCKGVVLKFEGELIEKAEKVEYEDFEILPTVINTERFIELFLKKDREELHRFLLDLLVKKHRVWSYEQEYRLILNPYPALFESDENGNRYLKFNICNLKALYFGSSVSKSAIECYIEMLNKDDELSHIKLYSMTREPGYFSANPREINEAVVCRTSLNLT